MKNNLKKGYSLIELLVVIGIFALLGILVTQILITSMRASRKSESINMVRGNLDYAISVMERQIRNATSVRVLSPTVYCDDENGITVHTFTCLMGPGGLFWVDDSGPSTKADNLVASNVDVDVCSFVHIPSLQEGLPDAISIELGGFDTIYTGVESARVDIQAEVELRTYEY